MYKTIIYIFLAIVLSGFLFLTIAIFGIIKFTKDLPDYKQLREYTPSVISRLYTGDGSLLAEFSAEKRIFIPISSMPKKIIEEEIYEPEPEIEVKSEPIKISKRTGKPVRAMTEKQKENLAKGREIAIEKKKALNAGVDLERKAKVIKEYLKDYGDFPSNLIVRVSATMVDGAPHKFHKHTSTVVTKKTSKSYTCPAPTQGNECKDCRACWDKRVSNVAYLEH